jgi:3-polyprenyl-4-hydroxybenzoate decarboxylase
MAKTKLTKAELTRAQSIVDKIEAHKANIVKEKDALHDLYYELEDIVSSVESGSERIDTGLDWIRSGLDEMSQYI